METKICKKSTIAAVKKATNIYGYVKLSDDTGTYVKLNKKDFIQYLEHCYNGDLSQLSITGKSVYVG